MKHLFCVPARLLTPLLVTTLVVAAGIPRSSHAAEAATSADAAAKPAPLFNDLGTRHWPISTKNELAQRYFNQGMVLTYGFNHAEAQRSFLEVTKLDPDCPMGWWGASLVLGPNINVAMDPAAAPEAWRLVQEAVKRKANGTAREKALVEALERRYSANPPEDRKPLDIAFANAMRDLAKAYPDDMDIQCLFAEALMDLSPWNYWTRDGQPQVHTEELVGVIERVLGADPSHPGAIHFYIHAVEASNHPEKAEPYADKLGPLVPGSGHLVHMPSHIYIRTGRYQDAYDVNVTAAKADDSYLAQCHAQGVYPLGYVPHNTHFKFAAASLVGQSKLALEAATETDARTVHDMLKAPDLGMLQHYLILEQYGYVRFGMWDKALAAPKPAADLLYPVGAWHWMRGMAFAATGKLGDAEAELASLSTYAAMDTLNHVNFFGVNSAKQLLDIAREVLTGEIAARKGDWPTAIAHFEEGLQLEHEMRYNEPSEWAPSVSHFLGWAQLEAGRAAAAEATYREDLRRYPMNGWGLYGLMLAQEAQGKKDEAKATKAQFDKVWAKADVKISASRM